MENNLNEGFEQLKRSLLLMKYDTKKTLSENLQEQSTPESKIAGEIYAGGFGGGTDEEKIVNAVKQIKNPDQFKKVDDLLTKSYDRMGFIGKLEDEFNTAVGSDTKYLDQIKNHLQSIGVHFSYTPMRKDSMKVHFAPQNSGQQLPSQQKPDDGFRFYNTPGQQSPAQKQAQQSPQQKTVYVWKDSPFKDKTEGDQFRKWVNDNFPDFAKQIRLDPQGKHNNAYIQKAFTSKLPNSEKTYGQYYAERMNNSDMEMMAKKGVGQLPSETPQQSQSAWQQSAMNRIKTPSINT